MPEAEEPTRRPAIILIEEAPASASIHSSIITLVNSAIGAGILALPYAFRCTGWAAGLACIFIMGSIEAYTLFILSCHAEQTGAKTYGALVHKVLGPRASQAMCGVSIVFLFLVCCAFLMVIGDTFHPLLYEAFGRAWWTSRNATIIAVGCSCVLPLTFRSSLGALRAVSSLAVTAILVVVGAVVYSSVRIMSKPGHSWGPVRAFNPSPEFFGALPLIVLSFSCHTNVISIFTELEQRPIGFRSATGCGQQQHHHHHQLSVGAGPSGYESLPTPQLLAVRSQRRLKSSKLRGMMGVIAVSISLTALLYSAMGLAGYLAFPADTKSDILLNFGCSNMLMQIARASVGLVITASYPVIHFPARAAIHELLHHTTGLQFRGSGYTAAESFAFFGSTLGIALWCTDLGAIFQLIGGTCGGIIILAVPGAFLIQYAYAKHRGSRQQLALLREQLLVPAAEEGGGGDGSEGSGVPVQQQAYSMWWSKLFLAGVALQLLAVALAVLTVLTVAHVLPSP